MHHSCISEWFKISLKCPICIQDITLESIQNKIQSNNEEGLQRVESLQMQDSIDLINYQVDYIYSD